MGPRLGEPNYTEPAAGFFFDGPPDLPEGGPIPTLRDPEGPRVTEPSREPLVLVEHERIRILDNYWNAGWSSAVPSTWLRAGVTERLVAIAERLPDRWGLAVFDGWRPLALQRELYEAAADHPGLMAPPSDDPTEPPPHLTGGAVDLTLTFDGTPLAPGSGFDDTTICARTTFCEDRPGPDRHIRRALFHAMVAEGFVNFPEEWWHFEWGTRRWAAITGAAPRLGPIAPPG